MLAFGGQPTVVEGAKAWNPVFDVTPAELIDVIVTERGVIEQPDAARMKALFGASAERLRPHGMAWRKEILFFAVERRARLHRRRRHRAVARARMALVDPYEARLVSFLCAATATWAFNRKFTFRGHGSRQPAAAN